jgi:hypothetical protein
MAHQEIPRHCSSLRERFPRVDAALIWTDDVLNG